MTITAHALSNSALRAIEAWRFQKKWESVAVRSPIFLLGHWRNGTTHLHNLIALDERFAFPTTYQALFPHSFLSCERVGTKLLELFLPRNRPMDNVEMKGSAPQEDEFALAVLSLRSPLLGWVFQRKRAHYDQFLTLNEISPDDLERWRNELLRFMQKLTWRYDRPLVLKSPPHTARIRRLLEMFPDAKFVHIHRNPFAVFQSCRRMFQVNFQMDALQIAPTEALDDWILGQYRQMYDAYFAERSLIPQGQLCEIAFESVEADPLGELRRVYQSLSLPEFAEVEPRVTEYLSRIADYKKNEFKSLPGELQGRIVSAWQRCFEEWDYPRQMQLPTTRPLAAHSQS